jgi:hypothetical protein
METNLTAKPPRYYVDQFDGSIFIVVDDVKKREICVCGDYDDWADSEQRAQKIATLLNENPEESQIS